MLTDVSLGMERHLSSITGQRSAIEARYLLGASIRESLKGYIREAVRAEMMPTINAMVASGAVYLPGIMAGQILSGAEPIEAVKYQKLIMFLIAGGTALGLITFVMGVRLLSDDRHRLRLDCLR